MSQAFERGSRYLKVRNYCFPSNSIQESTLQPGSLEVTVRMNKPIHHREDSHNSNNSSGIV